MSQILEELSPAEREWVTRRASREGSSAEEVLLEVVRTAIRRLAFEEAHDYARATTAEVTRRLA